MNFRPNETVKVEGEKLLAKKQNTNINLDYRQISEQNNLTKQKEEMLWRA